MTSHFGSYGLTSRQDGTAAAGSYALSDRAGDHETKRLAALIGGKPRPSAPTPDKCRPSLLGRLFGKSESAPRELSVGDHAAAFRSLLDAGIDEAISHGVRPAALASILEQEARQIRARLACRAPV